jgi:hypothetical protein
MIGTPRRIKIVEEYINRHAFYSAEKAGVVVRRRGPRPATAKIDESHAVRHQNLGEMKVAVTRTGCGYRPGSPNTHSGFGQFHTVLGLRG